MKYVFYSFLLPCLIYSCEVMADEYKNGVEEAKKEIICIIDNRIEEIYFSLKDVDSDDSYNYLTEKLNVYHLLKIKLSIEFDDSYWGLPVFFSY